MYNLNWTKFVEERLLSPIRKPKMRAMVQAFLAPVKTLHTGFLVFKDTQEKELKITPQVRIMRHWLNELFDFDERRFEIEDYVNASPILIWGESYNNPIYLPAYLSSSPFDFTVKAPCDLRDRIIEIKAFLDRYKLAGKRYNLIFLNPNGSVCLDQAPNPNNSSN